jgi:putative transcription factor
MDHNQDTTNIVWRKHTTEKKVENSSGKKIIKLENENEELSHSKISSNVRMEIQKARVAKKMTQKELANKINEKVEVIQSYENGKAIPDNRILQKLRRVLGIRLKK